MQDPRLQELQRRIESLKRQPYLDPKFLNEAIIEYNNYKATHPQVKKGDLQSVIKMAIGTYCYREDIVADDVFIRTGYPLDWKSKILPNITRCLSAMEKDGILVRMSRGVYQRRF